MSENTTATTLDLGAQENTAKLAGTARLERAKALASDHADPNFCLSVPGVTKDVLRTLLAHITEQETRMLSVTSFSEELSAQVERTANSADPDEDPDSYNAGFNDARAGVASKLAAALIAP